MELLEVLNHYFNETIVYIHNENVNQYKKKDIENHYFILDHPEYLDSFDVYGAHLFVLNGIPNHICKHAFVYLVTDSYLDIYNIHRVDGICVVGKDKVLVYEQLLIMRNTCISKNISFLFCSTGSLLRKGNTLYKIDEIHQIDQAIKANIRYERDWYKIDIFKRIQQSRFRDRFYLDNKDIEYIDKHGLESIREHAYEFMNQRLRVYNEMRDGKQTPMRGHPVFKAQHACGLCCRGCLKKWHGTDDQKVLSEQELEYMTDLCMEWIRRKYRR